MRSGRLRPGDRIPTERELMQQYGCARMTVHRAISDLADKGLILRRKKAGSFVAPPHVQTAVLEIPDIAAVIAARRAIYRFELIEAARRHADTLTEAVDLADFKGDVLVLDGLHVADGLPFAFEHRVISLAAAPEAETADFSREGPGGWLLGHIPWTQARVLIDEGLAVSPQKQAFSWCGPLSESFPQAQHLAMLSVTGS